ncbi:MAG: insulinase family protein [Candidatus Solibacter usitatus]|nr:insulinase family protein [Candidatus Solibacter usitatus]
MRGLWIAVGVVGGLLAQAPAKRAAAPPRPAGAQSYKDLKFPALRQVEIPKVDTHTLPNGMRLYLLENHELPTVNGFALVRTGNLFDPPDKVGLAQITGTVMRTGGTTQETGDALNEKLENIAASVESSIGESSGRVSFSALKENADEVLAVFKDILTSPEFRADKLELAKTQSRSSISRRNDDPHGIAAREFDSIVYGRDNSYGWRMDYQHVNRIAREDLIAFYKRYFFPSNLMLAVYGDFSGAEMKAKLEKLFAGWTATQPAVPPFPKISAKPAAGVFLAEKADVNQTFFEIGHLGGLLNDKDFAALEVMGDILGGGFRSRLFERVRTKLGYAYSISADWGADYEHPGLFQVSGSTKSLSTSETFQVIEEEIARLRDSEVTGEELKDAKDTVLNGFVFNFDTRSKTLNRLLNYEYFGYPKDFIFQYQKAVAAVTKADILRVARERLKPKELTFVAVGKPQDFGKPLDTLGRPVVKIDLTIPEAKVEAAKADAASLAKGKALLQRVQQAVGGAERLAGVKNVMQVVEIQLAPEAGGLKVKQTNRWMAPNLFRQEMELPFGKVASFSDGATGWMKTPQGEGPLPGQALKQAQGELFRAFPRLLLSDRDPDRTVNLAGEGVVEISGKDGNVARLTVDSAGLPAKVTYLGPQGEVEEAWSDFQEEGGLKLPRKTTVSQGGRKFADATVLEVKLNTAFTPEEMRKRP